MKVSARITMNGLYGNPNGSGEAIDTLAGLPAIAPATLKADIDTFYAAITTLFAATKGDVYLYGTQELTPAKPENNINVDEILTVDWTPDGTGRPRKLTIQGVTPNAVNSQQEAAGLRLNATGRNSIKASLDDVYGDTTTVPRGIFTRRA